MLKYLIVLLDDGAASFCHYNPRTASDKLISTKSLQQAVNFALKENLMVQFVYSDKPLPSGYEKIINSVDHINLKPYSSAGEEDQAIIDIRSYNGETFDSESAIVRGTLNEISGNIDIIASLLRAHKRVNCVLTDINSLSESDMPIYESFLDNLTGIIAAEFKINNVIPSVNILTDRLALTKMNNCNAGVESLTVAPDGKFYICPAFYYDGETDLARDYDGVKIPNAELYRIDHAPICRICDAFQCHRCIWQHRLKTLEVNTPGHMQCVIAHIERNASRKLLCQLRALAPDIPLADIPGIDYLDPFDKLQTVNR